MILINDMDLQINDNDYTKTEIKEEIEEDYEIEDFKVCKTIFYTKTLRKKRKNKKSLVSNKRCIKKNIKPNHEIKSEDEDDKEETRELLNGLETLDISDKNLKRKNSLKKPIEIPRSKSIMKIEKVLFSSLVDKKNDKIVSHEKVDQKLLLKFVNAVFEKNENCTLLQLQNDDEVNSDSDVSSPTKTVKRPIRRRDPRIKKSIPINRPEKKEFKKFIIDCPSSLLFKYNSYWYDKELPIMYGLAFNPYCYPDDVFAVCGAAKVVVCRCLQTHYLSNGMMPLFVHSDPNDFYYTCCWSYDTRRPDHYYLIFAGMKGVIRIVDVFYQTEVKTYYGHGEAINDLKVSPLDPTLLLSASKDFGIRLWNIATDVCVAVFSGVQGHRDEVVAIDFHQEKSIFVSVSLDHSIKIWSLKNREIARAIEDSRNYHCNINEKQFHTISQHYPNFSTRDVHHNYVDSVQWFGDFLITKSCEEKLVVWKPGSEKETLDDLMKRIQHSDLDSSASNVIIIKQFELVKNNLWFMKFSLDLNELLLAVGNLQGHLFIYDLKYYDPKKYRLVFEVPTPPIFGSQRSKKSIRRTAFNRDGTILIALSENSCVTRCDIARITKPMVLNYLKSIRSAQLLKLEELKQRTIIYQNDAHFKELVKKYLKYHKKKKKKKENLISNEYCFV